MPFAAPRPCTQPGCMALVRDGSGRCPEHPRAVWTKKVDAPKRITGRRLQAMRAALFKRQPLCEQCAARGVVTVATQRDHRLALAEGGTDTVDNEQALCQPCHDEKSEQERVRSLQRARR